MSKALIALILLFPLTVQAEPPGRVLLHYPGIQIDQWKRDMAACDSDKYWYPTEEYLSCMRAKGYQPWPQAHVALFERLSQSGLSRGQGGNRERD